MSNIENGSFVPFSSKLRNAYTRNEEVLFYGYKPVDWKEQGLRKEVVVAKLPGYPNQTIIGPIKAVNYISKAFNILDSLFDDKIHRELNVVVTVGFDLEKWIYSTWKDGKPVTRNLLDTFGLTDHMQKSRYPKYRPGKTHVGVFADIGNPLFLSPDYSVLADIWGEEFIPLYFACVLKHESTHAFQARNSLPVESLWAERHAMRDQMLVLIQMLNSGRFKKETESTILGVVQNLMLRASNYRNGRGFQDHFATDNHGSPLNDQKVFKHEIEFGY